MYFWLLWILLALSGGLVAAWWVAVVARIRHWVPRYLLLVIVVAVGLVPAVMFGAYLFALEYMWRTVGGLFVPYATLVAVVFGACVFLAIRGLRRKDEVRQASNWSLKRLTLGAAGSFVASLFVFWLMDQAVQREFIAWEKELKEELRTYIVPLEETPEDPNPVYERIAGEFPEEVISLFQEAGKANPSDWAPQSVMVAPETIAFAESRPERMEELRQASLLPDPHNQTALAESCNEFLDDRTFSGGIASKLDKTVTVYTYLKASQGDLRGAMEDLAIFQQLNRQVAQRKSTFGQIVSMVFERSAQGLLESLLKSYPIREADLDLYPQGYGKSIQQRLTEVRPIERIMISRDMIELYLGTSPRLQVTPSTKTLLSVTLMPKRVFAAQYDRDTFLAKMKEIEAYSNLPSKQAIKRAREILSEARSSRMGIFGRLLYPGVPTFCEWGMRSDTERQVAEVAIAAYRHTLRHGDFPESLEVLREIDPNLNVVDPYSDAPLKMLRKDNMLTIFSVGPNGTDDGGAPYSRERGKEVGDLPFTIGKGAAGMQ